MFRLPPLTADGRDLPLYLARAWHDADVLTGRCHRPSMASVKVRGEDQQPAWKGSGTGRCPLLSQVGGVFRLSVSDR
jgi:hypothetical protein